MVKVPIWEPNVSDLPGASNVPHATPEAFGSQIGAAQQKAGADIAKGIEALGGALSSQADEQEAIKSKVTLSDHETAVQSEYQRLQTTTPASDAAKIPDMVNQFAQQDWAERRDSIGGKYQGIADSNAHVYWNKLYIQNQAQSVKQYYDAVETQIKGETNRQGMLVFADPNNMTAATGAVRAYVDETNFPPEMKRSLLVDAATTLQTQALAGYKLRIQNAEASNNFAEAVRLQGEAAKAAVALPGQLTSMLGINALPTPVAPPVTQPGQPLPRPPTLRPTTPMQKRSEADQTDQTTTAAATPPSATTAEISAANAGVQPTSRQQAAQTPSQKTRVASLGPAGASGEPTATTSQKPYDIAASMLGYEEHTHRDVLAKFIGNVGGQKVDPATTAWCAAFVNAVLRKSGQDGTDSLMARSFLRYGTATDQPQKGDIVVMARGRPGSGLGHVGFYAGEENGRIKVLAGNTRDRVAIGSYSPNSVISYRRITNKQVAANNTPDMGFW